jgi:hypothetical protein
MVPRSLLDRNTAPSQNPICLKLTIYIFSFQKPITAYLQTNPDLLWHPLRQSV